jgi:hypothetical protein
MYSVDGVTERLFTLGDITGASWSAGDADGERPLHVNLGRHAEVPAFELESSERFLVRHLRGLAEHDLAGLRGG